MAHLGYDKNANGTRISKHRCDVCSREFTVCPPAYPEQKGWDNCLDKTCTSYDPKRDLDLLFDDSGLLKEGAKLEVGPIIGIC